MPLPESLRSALDDPRFWPSYFHEIGGLPSSNLSHWEVTFSIGEGNALVLRLARDLQRNFLGLLSPEMSTPANVSLDYPWETSGNYYPHVLRWSELEVIGRAVALLDPDLPHPGLPLLFLSHYSPITGGDDRDVIVPMFEAAWRSVGVASGRTISARINRLDARDEILTWRHLDHFVWYFDPTESSGAGPITTYQPELDRQPIRPWAGMIAAARRTCDSAVRPEWRARDGGIVADLARSILESATLDALPYLADALEEAGCDRPALLDACRSGDAARGCWAVETIAGVEPGTFIRPYCRRSRTSPSPDYSFRIDLRASAESAIIGRLDRALADAGLGDAQFVGRRMVHDDAVGYRREHASVNVRIFEHLEEGLALIRRDLLDAGVPDDTRIEMTDPEHRWFRLREA